MQPFLTIKIYLTNGEFIKEKLAIDPLHLDKLLFHIGRMAASHGSTFEKGWYKCSCHNVEEKISDRQAHYIRNVTRLAVK